MLCLLFLNDEARKQPAAAAEPVLCIGLSSREASMGP